MRVLIIKTAAAGEIVSSLPVLDYLKHASGAIEIDWVVEEQFQEILEENPLLSGIYPVPADLWRSRPFSPRTWRGLAELKETLRAREYDLVFDLQGDFVSGLIGWLTGAEDRIGFEKKDLQESAGALFGGSRRIPLRRQDYHLTDRALRLVSVPFARDYREMQLCSIVRTSCEDDADAETLLATLSDGLVFMFQCGAESETALWSEANWVSLGKAVLDRFRDCTILLPWGSESERGTVGEIAQAIGRGTRVVENLSFKGLAALFKRADLVVGGDVAGIKLAALLGTPTVSFYRSGDGRLSGPRGNRHVVIQSPMHCSRCRRSRCDKDLQCRETIKVDRVLAGVVQQMEGELDAD
jgi:heptosyltransferase I